MIRPFATLACALALAALAPACGDEACHEGHCHVEEPDAAPGTPDAAPVVVDETRTLIPTQIDEGVFTAGPGAVITITATSSAATLDWNIHGHAGGGTQTVTEAFGVGSIAYTFEPTAQADWFLLLRNSGAADIDVDIRLDIVGGTFSGWE
ncbi:MAG: hypothetical protein R2939_06870 [Kofleriaceae bacterium]